MSADDTKAELTLQEVLDKHKRKRARYTPTHMIMINHDPKKPDIAGMAQGFRGVHFLTERRKWVYVIDTGETDQTLRKVPVDTWRILMRSKSTRVL